MSDFNLPFDRFFKKQPKVRRNYAIEEELYEILQRLSNEVYDVDVVDLVNVSIEDLINDKDFVLEKETRESNTFMHLFRIYESNIAGLEKMKSQYGGVSINRLVNIAIRRTLNKHGYNFS